MTSTPYPELSARMPGSPPPEGLQEEIRELEHWADRGDEAAVRERLRRLLAHPASDAVEYAGR